MKRMVSVLLTIVLLCSMVPTAFTATDEAVDAANKLYTLGLFKGTGTDANGNPIFDLDAAPTRNQAIIMLVRLLGAETKAVSGTWETPFTDLNETAAPYIGYAYTNGLTTGTTDTTFGGSAKITANQYIVFMLRSLGYVSGTDFQYADACTFAAKIRLINYGAYSIDTTNFTRGDVAIISNNSLQCPRKEELDPSAKAPKSVLDEVYTAIKQANDAFDEADSCTSAYSVEPIIMRRYLHMLEAKTAFIKASMYTFQAYNKCNNYKNLSELKSKLHALYEVAHEAETYHLTEENCSDYFHYALSVERIIPSSLMEIYGIYHDIEDTYTT